MRERSLVAFTLLTQAAVGTCWSLLAVQMWAARAGARDVAGGGAGLVLLVAFLAASGGLAAAFLHLGRPSNAWRALWNLRSSWLSREIFFASAFTGALGASTLLSLREGSSESWLGFTEGLAAVFGVALVWSMAMAYRLRTVPAWDRWTTSAAFFATALGLGTFTVASVLVARGGAQGLRGFPTGRLVFAALLFHLLGAAATLLWLRRLRSGALAERESLRRIVEHKHLIATRFALSALVLVAGIAVLSAPGWPWPWIAACLFAFGAEAAGRSLFYEARVRVGV